MVNKDEQKSERWPFLHCRDAMQTVATANSITATARRVSRRLRGARKFKGGMKECFWRHKSSVSCLRRDSACMQAGRHARGGSKEGWRGGGEDWSCPALRTCMGVAGARDEESAARGQ